MSLAGATVRNGMPPYDRMEEARRSPLNVAFVVHVMQVAGAEVLVAETIRRLVGRIDPVVLCLDSIGQLGERLLAEGVPVVSLGRRPGRDSPRS